jgi:ribosomal protein S18 acetylase RimI-like enzyme
VAATEDGRIVGFLYHIYSPGEVVHRINGAVHPDFRGRGIGAQMIRWAEQQALEQLGDAPDGSRVVIQTIFFTKDKHAQALFWHEGYTFAREWVHLQITMDELPPPAEWPQGFTVRQMDQSRDWPAVGEALDEAFRDHWGEMQPVEDSAMEDAADETEEEEEEDDEDDPYSNSRDFCFVAMVGDQVAGSCLGNAKTIEWPDSGKIGSLSIRRPYRRLGIGRALTLHALGQFYEHDIRRVIIDTDADGFTGAYRLYQQAGMDVYRREVTYEKELRPGHELRLLSSIINSRQD